MPTGGPPGARLARPSPERGNAAREGDMPRRGARIAATAAAQGGRPRGPRGVGDVRGRPRSHPPRGAAARGAVARARQPGPGVPPGAGAAAARGGAGQGRGRAAGAAEDGAGVGRGEGGAGGNTGNAAGTEVRRKLRNPSRAVPGSKSTRLLDPATWFSLSEAYFEKRGVSPHAKDILLANGDMLKDPGDNILNRFFYVPVSMSPGTYFYLFPCRKKRS